MRKNKIAERQSLNRVSVLKLKFSCWIRTGIELLKSEAEFNIQFKSTGSRSSKRVEWMMKDKGPRIRSALLMVMRSAAGEKERTGLSYSKICREREKENRSILLERLAEERKFWALSPPFMLLGKVLRAEWDKSSLLGENIRRDRNGQINLGAKQKFGFLFATDRYVPIRCYQSGPEWTWEGWQ